MNKLFNKIIGNKGENIACEYLKKQGYVILDQNYHFSKNSEIDIIAQDKDCLVFVEVKTRTNLSCGHPFESINNQKLQKIQTGILGYISTQKKNISSYRIDCIAIIGLENPVIEHIKNIGQF